MLEHRTPEGRSTPPVYTPEELSWLTGTPVAMPPELVQRDNPTFWHRATRLDDLDDWLDAMIERLLALRDAIGAEMEDREDDDPAGGGCGDDEPMLGWSEAASRLQARISDETVRFDEGEDSDPAEEGDPAELDDQDRCQAEDDVGTFNRRGPSRVHTNRPQVEA